MDIRAKGRKAVKTIQDKLDAEIAAHGRTKEERDKLHEEGIKKENIISALREAALNKSEWYDEQLENDRKLCRGVEIRFNNEMGRLEGLHEKESQIW